MKRRCLRRSNGRIAKTSEVQDESGRAEGTTKGGKPFQYELYFRYLPEEIGTILPHLLDVRQKMKKGFREHLSHQQGNAGLW